MYSRSLIHPRLYENTPKLHSEVWCLWWLNAGPVCGIKVQVSCIMVF